MNLYQIANDYVEILEDLYDEEGEINEQALAKLESANHNMEKKCTAISSFIKNMEAEDNAIKEAQKALAQRKKRLVNNIDNLKGYLQVNMEKCQIQKITTPYFVIKLKKCPVSVGIFDEQSIPDEYIRVKISKEPDKIKMLADMKEGVVIPGAGLQQRISVDIK
jgi:predicted nuclease with TOPRIM domain